MALLVQVGGLLVPPVHRDGVLGEVVRSHAEEVHTPRQQIARDGGGRNLYHSAHGHVLVESQALGSAFTLDFVEEGEDLVKLIHRGYHREHDAYPAFRRRPQDRPQLGAEHVLMAHAEADRTQTERRIGLLVAQTLHELVRPHVISADRDVAATGEASGDLPVYPDLLVLVILVVTHQEELRPEQADAFGSVLQCAVDEVQPLYVAFQMDVKRESGMTPVRVEKLCFKYDKTKPKGIINKLSFSLHKGEKFLIVGENGVGKSTLLKLIVGILKPDFGTIEIGNHTDIGYYAQEHELLDKTTTIFDNFHDTDLNDKEIRSALGRFLFSGDEVFKNVSILSPGEQSRVALAKLSVSGANFLILDEPTNHLDPDTQKIISKAFQSFEGTMLVVSHNPEFVHDLGIGRILLLPEGKIVPYDEEIVKHYHTLNTKHFKNRQNPL